MSKVLILIGVQFIAFVLLGAAITAFRRNQDWWAAWFFMVALTLLLLGVANLAVGSGNKSSNAEPSDATRRSEAQK